MALGGRSTRQIKIDGIYNIIAIRGITKLRIIYKKFLYLLLLAFAFTGCARSSFGDDNTSVSEISILTNTSYINTEINENTKERTSMSETTGNNNDNDSRGNSLGNIINGGYATYYEDKIYFINGFDTGGRSDSKIYRVDPDGNNIIKLCDDRCEYINVYNGYIFFTNLSEQRQLYRMDLDGTNKVPLTEMSAEYVNIVDGIIYYIDYLENQGIYKMNMEGGEVERITDDKSIDMNVIDSWIYYGNLSDEGRLYKISTDGSSKIKISDDSISNLIVYCNEIYYINSDDMRIYRVTVNGTDKINISSDSCDDFNIYNGYIYYSNINDFEIIYRMNLDGSEQEIIGVEHYSDCLNIAGGWIFYDISNAEYSEQYMIKLDGSENHFIER
jgi:hypothetical protein